MPTCTVYVRDYRDGHLVAGHVTAADTVFEACRTALAWWESPHGRPLYFGDDTILEVHRLGREKGWIVRGGDGAENSPGDEGELGRVSMDVPRWRATYHLDRYVQEFAWRLNEGNVQRHSLERLASFISAIVGKRLTYKELIA